MKKNILFLLAAIIIVSCGTKVKKPEQRSKFLKGFTTHYNTLFNAKDALNSEFTSRDLAHKDNFYAPYIPILTYEDQPIGSDLGQSSAFAENSVKMGEINRQSKNNDSGMPSNPFAQQNGRSGVPQNPTTIDQKGATVLEIAEAKALKAIGKYSVIKKGAEQNKTIFDAYIILAQARIYQGKSLQALDALNYVFTHMKEDKRLPLARVYEGLAYAQIKNYHKSEEIFTKLKSDGISK